MVQNIEDTLKERGANYGEFQDQAIISQDLKAVMYGTPGWQRLAPYQKEALEVIAHKIARILNGNPNFHDSWHDIVGYAKLVADRVLGLFRSPTAPTPPGQRPPFHLNPPRGGNHAE